MHPIPSHHEGCRQTEWESDSGQAATVTVTVTVTETVLRPGRRFTGMTGDIVLAELLGTF